LRSLHCERILPQRSTKKNSYYPSLSYYSCASLWLLLCIFVAFGIIPSLRLAPDSCLYV
jgi:hypothetical protein